MKTGIERGIFSKYKRIIDLVNKGGERNIAKAEKVNTDLIQAVFLALLIIFVATCVKIVGILLYVQSYLSARE